ncbi:MAG: hypothetical protein QNJ69_03620 [Gammaproteobacteria bacterium]|nr:hypothetical protein [Gammaproteobacteria bacterium]
MKKSIALILLTPLLAYAECDSVVPGYEKQDVMYVLCSELKIKNDVQATKLIKKVMGQYKGPPDEILVHFVKSQSSVGVLNPSPEQSVGYYYTHSNELVIWPDVKSKTKAFKINWN